MVLRSNLTEKVGTTSGISFTTVTCSRCTKACQTQNRRESGQEGPEEVAAAAREAQGAAAQEADQVSAEAKVEAAGALAAPAAQGPAARAGRQPGRAGQAADPADLGMGKSCLVLA